MEQIPSISVIVPCYNEPWSGMQDLYTSLLDQTLSDFEVIIIDDGSSQPDYSSMTDPRFRVIYKKKNSGPADSRNRGAAEARAGILFFTDADCRPAPDTLTRVRDFMAEEAICVGNTITMTSSFLGRAIAYLGFPGGGLLGFHNVWQVDEYGYTNSISSCNLAIRRDLFHEIGGFDAGFPAPAGEDTMLAYTLVQRGHPIRYVPEQTVWHVERDSLHDFMQWQRTRGRGVYHVRRRVGAIGGYARQRFRTFGRALLKAGPYAPVVVALFLLSLLCQWQGFRREARRWNHVR